MHERWSIGVAATVGAVLGPALLLALWLRSMVPWPEDAPMEVAAFFGGALAGGLLCATAAAIRNMLLRPAG